MVYAFGICNFSEIYKFRASFQILQKLIKFPFPNDENNHFPSCYLPRCTFCLISPNKGVQTNRISSTRTHLYSRNVGCSLLLSCSTQPCITEPRQRGKNAKQLSSQTFGARNRHFEPAFFCIMTLCFGSPDRRRTRREP